jgi:hypothetical protein
MIFASSAVAGGLIMADLALPGKLVGSGIYTFAPTVAYQIVNVYAIRMAAVSEVS